MALIVMAAHDTADNGRTKYTDRTIESLLRTVDFDRHRLFISDNGSCEDTQRLYEKLVTYWTLNKYDFGHLTIHRNGENLGTAKAVNIGLKTRKDGEYCIKMDNDVVIHQRGWVDELEEAIEREPAIGILGLKRKDLWQWPGHPDKQYKSHLVMLPHKPGERWIIVEITKDIMGTCTMFNHLLLDKVGGLYQPSLYGYDDVLMCYRSNIAGFLNAFLTHIHIDHIDEGQNEYGKWKERESGKVTQEIIALVDEYIAGIKSIYHEL